MGCGDEVTDSSDGDDKIPRYSGEDSKLSLLRVLESLSLRTRLVAEEFVSETDSEGGRNNLPIGVKRRCRALLLIFFGSDQDELA